MRTLVHLSDLHFGRVDHDVIGPLVETVHEIQPDLVAISGDLTQRARSQQFREARDFLATLPQPQIVVPGNHDVPLHNVFARLFQPLSKYRRYINDDLQPVHADPEMIVVGVNTARSLAVKGGRINSAQVGRIKELFCSTDDELAKVVVTHHPFDLPEGHDDRHLVGRAEMAMSALARCGADLFLSGHLHLSRTGHTAKRYNIKGHSALVVQAGTATSTRGRGEMNSFNVVRIQHPEITVERFVWDDVARRFEIASSEEFQHSDDGWIRK